MQIGLNPFLNPMQPLQQAGLQSQPVAARRQTAGIPQSFQLGTPQGKNLFDTMADFNNPLKQQGAQGAEGAPQDDQEKKQGQLDETLFTDILDFMERAQEMASLSPQTAVQLMIQALGLIKGGIAFIKANKPNPLGGQAQGSMEAQGVPNPNQLKSTVNNMDLLMRLSQMQEVAVSAIKTLTKTSLSDEDIINMAPTTGLSDKHVTGGTTTHLPWNGVSNSGGPSAAVMAYPSIEGANIASKPANPTTAAPDLFTSIAGESAPQPRTGDIQGVSREVNELFSSERRNGETIESRMKQGNASTKVQELARTKINDAFKSITEAQNGNASGVAMKNAFQDLNAAEMLFTLVDAASFANGHATSGNHVSDTSRISQLRQAAQTVMSAPGSGGSVF